MNTQAAQNLMTPAERARYRELANSKRKGSERIFDQLKAAQILIDAAPRGRTRV